MRIRILCATVIAVFLVAILLLAVEKDISLVDPDIEKQLESIDRSKDIVSALVNAGYSKDDRSADGVYEKYIKLSDDTDDNLFCWSWIDVDVRNTEEFASSSTSMESDTGIYNAYTCSTKGLVIYIYECVDDMKNSVIEEELLFLLDCLKKNN